MGIADQLLPSLVCFWEFPMKGARRDELNAKRSQRMAGEPEDESPHFYVFKTCGQVVDERRLGEVKRSTILFPTNA